MRRVFIPQTIHPLLGQCQRCLHEMELADRPGPLSPVALPLCVHAENSLDGREMEGSDKRVPFRAIRHFETLGLNRVRVKVHCPDTVAKIPAKKTLGSDFTISLKVIDNLVALQVLIADVVVIQGPLEIEDSTVLCAILTPPSSNEPFADVLERAADNENLLLASSLPSDGQRCRFILGTSSFTIVNSNRRCKRRGRAESTRTRDPPLGSHVPVGGLGDDQLAPADGLLLSPYGSSLRTVVACEALSGLPVFGSIFDSLLLKGRRRFYHNHMPVSQSRIMVVQVLLQVL
mmetsp:Transcript_7770/g.26206  ORF Transcript_7770/g.26206 Transcript_7770/m.26206 type:complete len:289 (+) Transcript_7770:1683-2549(+)